MTDGIWAETPVNQLTNTHTENRNCLYAFLEVIGPEYVILKSAFRIVMGQTENLIVIENSRTYRKFLCIKRYNCEWDVHNIGRYPLEKLWNKLIGSNKIVLTRNLQDAAELDDATIHEITNQLENE